jgi:hypothetical protein
VELKAALCSVSNTDTRKNHREGNLHGGFCLYSALSAFPDKEKGGCRLDGDCALCIDYGW